MTAPSPASYLSPLRAPSGVTGLFFHLELHVNRDLNPLLCNEIDFLPSSRRESDLGRLLHLLGRVKLDGLFHWVFPPALIRRLLRPRQIHGNRRDVGESISDERLKRLRQEGLYAITRRGSNGGPGHEELFCAMSLDIRVVSVSREPIFDDSLTDAHRLRVGASVPNHVDALHAIEVAMAEIDSVQMPPHLALTLIPCDVHFLTTSI